MDTRITPYERFSRPETQHLLVISMLLYNKSHEQLEARALEADISSRLATKHRRERLLLADTLKAEHEATLKAEVELLNKRLEATNQYVTRELQEIKPKALNIVLEKYASILDKLTSGRGGLPAFHMANSMSDDENDEDSSVTNDDIYATRMKPADLTLSPPIGNRRSHDALSERPAKKKRATAAGAMEFLGAMGLDDEGRAVGELSAAVSKETLKRNFREAFSSTKREHDDDFRRRTDEEIKRIVVSLTEQVRAEMEEAYELKLEEEKERVRVMTELAADAEKKELEERLRAECAEEVRAVLRKVGLAE